MRERLQLGDAVVLAPGRAHEHTRALEQGAVALVGKPANDAHAVLAVLVDLADLEPDLLQLAGLRARDHELAARHGAAGTALGAGVPAQLPPRAQHAVEALLGGVGRVRDGRDVPLRARPRWGALDGDGQHQRASCDAQACGLCAMYPRPPAAAGAPARGGGARADAASSRGAPGGLPRRGRRSGPLPRTATAARRSRARVDDRRPPAGTVASALCAAVRAARAHARSVAISVRFGAGALARTSVARAPARSSDSCSC